MFLALNNITIKVARESGAEAAYEHGARDRAQNGDLRTTRNALKDSWRIVTTPLLKADSVPLKALVQGRGHSWDMTKPYSSKGLGTSGTSGSALWNQAGGPAAIGSPKKLVLDATEYVEWTPTRENALTGDFTITVWYNAGGTWQHWIARRSGSTVTYYLNGGSNAGPVPGVTLPTAPPTSNGIVRLGDASAREYSNLVALPYAIPTGWAASLFGATRPFPALPVLEVKGEICDAPSTPRSVVGTLIEREPRGFTASGDGGSTGGKRCEFILEEV